MQSNQDEEKIVLRKIYWENICDEEEDEYEKKKSIKIHFLNQNPFNCQCSIKMFV